MLSIRKLMSVVKDVDLEAMPSSIFVNNFGSSDHKLIFCNLGTDVDIVKDFKTRFDYNRII